MKKIILLLLVATLVFAFSACGKNKDTTVKEDTNKTTEQIQTDENDDDSQTESSNKLENNSSNEQSSVDSKTDTNNTTTNNNSNKNNNQSNGNGTTTKPTTNSQTNTHKHSFSAATCTQPKKCSCGATEGSALGHKWVDATCTTLKTCSVCKATSGSALGHNYDIDGVCTRCKAEDPDFTYPTVSSMGGAWKYVFESDDEMGHSVYFHDCYFDYGNSKGVFWVGGCGYLLEEDFREYFGEEYVDPRDIIVWNNQRYYLNDAGSVFGNKATYYETNDTIKITFEDKEMILQRVSTNTIKVKYVEEGFFGSRYFPVNTILTFEKE